MVKSLLHFCNGKLFGLLETKHRNIRATIFEVGTNYIQSDDQTQPNKHITAGLQISDLYKPSVCEV